METLSAAQQIFDKEELYSAIYIANEEPHFWNSSWRNMVSTKGGINPTNNSWRWDTIGLAEPNSLKLPHFQVHSKLIRTHHISLQDVSAP